MSTNVSRDDVLRAIDAEREHWESIVSKANENGMANASVTDDWTFKDLVGHLNGWRERGNRRLKAAANGEQSSKPPWPETLKSVDEVNDWIYEHYRVRSLDDVLTESRNQLDEMRGLVAGFSDEELNDAGKFNWLEGKSLGAAIVDGYHFRHLRDEHSADIQKVLAGGG